MTKHDEREKQLYSMDILEFADEIEEYHGDMMSEVTATRIRQLVAENEMLKKNLFAQQNANIDLVKQLDACALLNYNKGHEDGRKLATPSPTDKGVLFTEYNEEVSRGLWLDSRKEQK